MNCRKSTKLCGIVALLGSSGCQAADYAEGKEEPLAETQENLGTNRVPVGAALSVGLPSSLALHSVALAARGDLVLNDRAEVHGASGGFAKAVNLGRGTTNIGADSRTGDILSHAPVVLRDRAKVAGSVTSIQDITPQSNVIVTGSMLEHTRIERASERAWVAVFAPSAPSVTLFSGQTRVLAPGSHGSVTVNAGATLTLGSGTYNLESLKLEPSSKLVFNSSAGRILLNVRSEFILRGQVQNRAAVADDVLIGYLGSTATLEAPFAGTLVAPNARIKIEGLNGAMHYGALFGRDIEMHQDAEFTHVPFAHWDEVPLLFDGSESLARVPFDLSAALVGSTLELTYRPHSGLLTDLTGVTINVVPSLPEGDRWIFRDRIGLLIPCHPSPSQPQLDCLNAFDTSLPLHEIVSVGQSPLDRLIDVIRCRTFGCPSSLGDEFKNDSRYDVIKENLKFQTTGAVYDRFAESIKTPWSQWSTSRSEFPNQPEFYDALEDAWDWLHKQERFTDFDGQPETALTETGHEANEGDLDYTIAGKDAWQLYLNWVAHNVALDRKGELPWTLADLVAIDEGLLAPLLDSTEMMFRRVFEPVEYTIGLGYHPNFDELPVGSYLGATILGQPRYTYRFMSQSDIVQSSRVDSIGALIDWAGGMSHYFGSGTQENHIAHWGHPFFPTVEMIVEGTVRTGESEPRRWTAGCHGTTQFFKDVLRAINIPVRIPVLCAHATLSFPSEGLYIDHGDNPYNSSFRDSATCEPKDLLIDHDTFWEHFGHEGMNHNDADYCEADPGPVARSLSELACVE